MALLSTIPFNHHLLQLEKERDGNCSQQVLDNKPSSERNLIKTTSIKIKGDNGKY